MMLLSQKKEYSAGNSFYFGAFIQLFEGFCVLYVSPACVSLATVEASNTHSLRE